MTNNQIQYQRNLETERANRAQEALGRDTMLEAARHNKVSENETGRHNRATEVETSRHNVKDENLRSAQNATLNAHYNRADDIAASGLAETIKNNATLRQQGATKLAQDLQIARERNETQIKSATISQTGSWVRTAVDVLTKWLATNPSGLGTSIVVNAPSTATSSGGSVSTRGGGSGSISKRGQGIQSGTDDKGRDYGGFPGPLQQTTPGSHVYGGTASATAGGKTTTSTSTPRRSAVDDMWSRHS